MTMVRIAADCKWQMLYKCATCGASAVGGTARGRLDCASVEELRQALLLQRPSPHTMPIGWSSHPDGFRCPEHRPK